MPSTGPSTKGMRPLKLTRPSSCEFSSYGSLRVIASPAFNNSSRFSDQSELDPFSPRRVELIARNDR
jgi:hypothetical protein